MNSLVNANPNFPRAIAGGSTTSFLTFSIIALHCVAAIAQDVGQPTLSDREVIDQTVRNLEVYLRDAPKKLLKPHLVIRWPNPVRAVNDGATAIWTENGRPKAACCIWASTDGTLGLSPGLLSESMMIAELEGETIWRPKRMESAATELRSIPQSPPPAETPAQRLRQMKLLAKRFSSDLQRVNDREAFRLLPAPVYRYELPPPLDDNPNELKGPGLLDGALFAFVQGTDPEMLLMIEARRSGDSYKWQYSASKRTRSPITVFLDGKLVASLAESRYDDREADFTWWVHAKLKSVE